ncbi:hypothetical protein AB0F15_35205 [Amycolatopsis sp. NPDC026612]
MISRLRAAFATLFVVFSLAFAFAFAFAFDATTTTPAAPRPDCIRPCHF